MTPNGRVSSCLIVVSLLVSALAGCERTREVEPTADAPALLSGTVLYRERIALPSDATVYVRLEDAPASDMEGSVLAEQTIPADGRQVPIPFELSYDSSRIDPARRYTLHAEIRDVAGETMFATPERQTVLAQGAPTTGIEVLVRRAPARAAQPASNTDGAAGALVGSPWTLVAWQVEGATEEAIDSKQQHYTAEFAADGGLVGLAHCNRYFARYTLTPGSDGLSVSGVGATLMACAAPGRESEFLRAIEAATRYEQSGDRLRLVYGDNSVLTFTRAAGEPAAAAPETARTFVYDCANDVSFTVRTGPGEVALWIPEALGGQHVVLSATPSGSGARYQEGETVYWSKGDAALFEVGGRQFTECRTNPAKALWADAAHRGVTFRALGQEPGWSFEVRPGQTLTLVTDYGAKRTEAPFSEPVVDGVRTTWHAVIADHDLIVIAERVACADSMSGEAFEATVTVTLDGETLHGCGRFP